MYLFFFVFAEKDYNSPLKRVCTGAYSCVMLWKIRLFRILFLVLHSEFSGIR